MGDRWHISRFVAANNYLLAQSARLHFQICVVSSKLALCGDNITLAAANRRVCLLQQNQPFSGKTRTVCFRVNHLQSQKSSLEACRFWCWKFANFFFFCSRKRKAAAAKGVPAHAYTRAHTRIHTRTHSHTHGHPHVPDKMSIEKFPQKVKRKQR